MSATRLFQGGVPEHVIQGRTGHKTVQALRVYQKPSELQQVAASKVLDNGQPYASFMEPKADSTQGLGETAKADKLKEGQLELKEGQLELKEGQLELKEGQLELKEGQLELKEGQLEHQSERGRENPVALSGCLFTNYSTVNSFVGKQ